jgi:hypothetical protein
VPLSGRGARFSAPAEQTRVRPQSGRPLLPPTIPMRSRRAAQPPTRSGTEPAMFCGADVCRTACPMVGRVSGGHNRGSAGSVLLPRSAPRHQHTVGGPTGKAAHHRGDHTDRGRSAFQCGRLKLSQVPPNRLAALARYALGSKAPQLEKASRTSRGRRRRCSRGLELIEEHATDARDCSRPRRAADPGINGRSRGWPHCADAQQSERSRGVLGGRGDLANTLRRRRHVRRS